MNTLFFLSIQAALVFTVNNGDTFLQYVFEVETNSSMGFGCC